MFCLLVLCLELNTFNHFDKSIDDTFYAPTPNGVGIELPLLVFLSFRLSFCR